MKNKFKNAKYTLGYEIHKNPFKAINAGMRFFGVETFKEFTTDIFLFSTQKEIYSKESVPNIIDLSECIKDFIFISYHICACKYKKTNYRITDPELLKVKLTSKTNWIIRWAERTQMLDVVSCQNPYVVFDQIFEKWHPEHLYEHFENALYAATTTYEGDEIFEFNFLDVYISIMSLIEACYLIFSFEIYPINNHLGLKPLPQD